MSGEFRLVAALETSARPASVALMNANGDLASRTLDDERSHASDLLVELAAATEELSADRGALDLVIVGTGPGSYTGLRVGTATALGLHRGAGAKLIGVPSFESIAWSGLEPGETGTVVRNAFGGQVYTATYERAASGIEVIDEPACTTPDGLRDSLGAVPVERRAILLADEGAVRALGATVDELDADIRGDAMAHADALLTLGLAHVARGGPGGPESIRPLYLRPFEAKVRRR